MLCWILYRRYKAQLGLHGRGNCALPRKKKVDQCAALSSPTTAVLPFFISIYVKVRGGTFLFPRIRKSLEPIPAPSRYLFLRKTRRMSLFRPRGEEATGAKPCSAEPCQIGALVPSAAKGTSWGNTFSRAATAQVTPAASPMATALPVTR